MKFVVVLDYIGLFCLTGKSSLSIPTAKPLKQCLPGEISYCQTLGAFKIKLKTHMFRAAYGL